MKAIAQRLQAHPNYGAFSLWRESLVEAEELRQRFEEWVFLNAAAVLFSGKTGELLTLSFDEFNLSASDVEDYLFGLSERWGFAYRMLDESERSLKFIVYDTGRLQDVLDEAPFCVMGAKLDYAYPLKADYFLEEVRERWQLHQKIPHEIGVALGYPLDDVFGYMGLLPLACKGVCGWQVYGCLRESQRRSCAFNDARCQALCFLAGSAMKRVPW